MHQIAQLLIATAAIVALGWTASRLTRRRYVQPSREGNDRLRLIFGSLHEGLIFHDRDRRIMEFNDAAARILELPEGARQRRPEELPAWRAIREDGSPWPTETHPVEQTLRTGQPLLAQVMGVERPDRPLVWLVVNTQPVFDDAGAVDGVILTFTDTTAERAAQAAQRSSEARFTALVERGTDIICVVDADGGFLYASPASDRLLGAGSMGVGRSILQIVHPDDLEVVRASLRDIADEPSVVITGEIRVRDRSGRWHNVEVVASNRLDDPAIGGIVCNVRDVTERTEAAAALSWQAFHDPLTGLPNRTLLLRRVDAALARARETGRTTAVLFLDLDRFKDVNDSMGHEGGDLLLVEIAERLSASVRTRDTVARLGGDEFIVLAESLNSRDEAIYLAERIRLAVARPVSLPQGTVTLTTSVGIAFDAGQQAAKLLRDADTALYKAKDSGRDGWEIFDHSLRAETIRRVAAEQVIRTALDEDGLRVHYQPIVDLVTGAVVGAEALLRIMGPHNELMEPKSFISIAENSGLIVPIGAGVLDDACRRLGRWREQLGADAPRTVSVNLSARQLTTPAFADMVQRTLDQHELEATSLILELTESTLIEAGRSAHDILGGLHDTGVGLAIDDFGTGYSSLAYLKRFPVDIVKVDRSFIDGLGEQASDTEIVKAVIALGQSLGLATVAEGVETQAQLDALRSLGCDCAQGYLLARPVPSDQLGEAVRQVRRTLLPR